MAAHAAHPTQLLDTLDAATRNTVIEGLWGPIPDRLLRDHADTLLEAYWDFYLTECEHALHDGGRHCLARTHQDILDMVALVKEDKSRDEIRAFLRRKLTKQHSNEEELVNCAIDLAASLLLMIDFGTIQHGFSGRRQLQWSKGSLKHCLEYYFCSPPVLGHEGVKLPRVFNALNLNRIAGVKIVPTNNLLDHLRLTDDDTKLYVFHHASFLKCQLSSSILPDGLVDETLRTLALLFPQTDPATRQAYRRLPAPFSVDSHLMYCGHLKTDDRQIESFRFWHDRLVVLKQVFDEATPSNLSQWWHDRRNGVQWYTFWVAIVVLGLTLFFGLVQSIEGALQVYGSFYGEKGS